MCSCSCQCSIYHHHEENEASYTYVVWLFSLNMLSILCLPCLSDWFASHHFCLQEWFVPAHQRGGWLATHYPPPPRQISPCTGLPLNAICASRKLSASHYPFVAQLERHLVTDCNSQLPFNRGFHLNTSIWHHHYPHYDFHLECCLSYVLALRLYLYKKLLAKEAWC